jgi:ABC-2 type transport system permease protein
MKLLQIQIRREFWEHRALWVAPVAVAATLLLLIAVFGHHTQLAQVQFDADKVPPVFVILLFGWAMVLYLTAAILISIYLLDCLYSERRDRSILFWKSLPVSDTRTVLIKFLVGFVIVPLGTFLLAALTGALAAGILSLRGAFTLHHELPLWNTLEWLRVEGFMLYGLIAALLWYAPYATYLMLASAWARRWPSAWAIIPPVLLAIFEYMILGTHYISRLARRSLGDLSHLAFRTSVEGAQNLGDAASQPAASGASHMMNQSIDPSGLLASPQLWLGLAAAALMLVLTIRLRRYRDDS